MKNIKLLLIGFLLCSINVLAQQTVNGIVKDKSSDELLPEVSIIVEGSSKGTETDFDGYFSLSNVKSGDVLVISYLG